MIKVLPAQLANMIAAGEVVGRPASVVKELVENSIDAGATDIHVVVSDSGRTLVQVIDNGCGMDSEEAVLCFERHATSKISTPEDLESILTFGFRGEALASIAAVAEVTLRTRKEGQPTGTEVVVGDYGHISSSEVSAPVGTSIAVRNLFYNTPARRKFLKSDTVEFKHIIEEFTHVALTRPGVSFTLTHNGRDVFVLKRAKSLKFRILDLMGSNVIGDIVDLSQQTALVSVSGFIGRPDTAKKTLGNQFFFVNGRYFRSPYLHRAVMNAYSDFMQDGLTPSYFIYLEVDPHSVDVNISPTKSEVKFEEESVIFQTLYACVRETLGRSSFGATIDFNTDGAVQMPQISRSFEGYKPADIAPAVDFDPTYNPFDTDNPLAGGTRDYTPSWQPDAPDGTNVFSGTSHLGGTQGYTAPKQDFGALFSSGVQAATREVLVVGDGRFVITRAQDGLMMVNVRRAQQRVIYEKTLRALRAGEHVTQRALFPVEVSVGAAQRLLFDEHSDLLRSLGFEISPFSQDSIVVSGMPEGYSCEAADVTETIRDLMPVLAEEHTALDEMMHISLAEKMAVVGSAHCQAVSGSAQAQQLLDTLYACDNPELTPAGKRITVVVSADELSKRF